MYLDGPPAGSVGLTPWSVPRPVVCDMPAADRELGYRPVVSYAESLPETVEWLTGALRGRAWREVFPLLAQVYPDLFDYAAETPGARLSGRTGGGRPGGPYGSGAAREGRMDKGWPGRPHGRRAAGKARMSEGRPVRAGRPSSPCRYGHGLGVACGAQVTSLPSSVPSSR